jgi:hypothetical protein
MIRFLLLTLLVLSIATPVNASTAKIYVWRNEKGELVYSDTPRPGAEEVKTKPGNVMKSSTKVDTQVLDINTKKIDDNYKVVIDHPKNNSTIRDNTGSIYISGSIKPIFKRGLKIQLILDDQPYQEPQTHTMFSLRNIDRGEHQIKMKLINEKGKVIALSEAITFYMHRASVN